MVSKLFLTAIVAVATLATGCGLVEDIFGPKDGPSTPAFTAEWKNELTLKLSANSKKLRDEFFEVQIYSPVEGRGWAPPHGAAEVNIHHGRVDTLRLLGMDAQGVYEFSRHTEVAQALLSAGLEPVPLQWEGWTGWVRD